MTDPLNKDTDGDGLLDGQEVFLYGTAPLEEDTDGDGLTDYAEVWLHFTDPTNPDSDGDGLPDKEELEQGADPTDPWNPYSPSSQEEVSRTFWWVLSILLAGLVIPIVGLGVKVVRARRTARHKNR